MFRFGQDLRTDRSYSASVDLVSLVCYRALGPPDHRAYLYLGKGEIAASRLSYGQLDRKAIRAKRISAKFSLESPRECQLPN